MQAGEEGVAGTALEAVSEVRRQLGFQELNGRPHDIIDNEKDEVMRQLVCRKLENSPGCTSRELAS